MWHVHLNTNGFSKPKHFGPRYWGMINTVDVYSPKSETDAAVSHCKPTELGTGRGAGVWLADPGPGGTPHTLLIVPPFHRMQISRGGGSYLR